MKKMYSYLKRAVASTAFLFFTLFSIPMDANAQKNDLSPDFAFPEKVENNADSMLKKALAENDAPGALRGAIQIIAARNSVSADSFNSNVALLDSISELLAPPYSGLAALIEARMYSQLYLTSPWQFNSRTLPLDSFPKNPMEWSRDLFAKRVLQLVDKATGDPAAAKATPISAISSILTNCSFAEKSEMSVYDFMVANCESLLSSFATASASEVIPFFGATVGKAGNVSEACSAKRNELVDDLYSSITANTSPAATAWAVKLKASTISSLPQRADLLLGWIEKMKDSPESGWLIDDYYNISASRSNISSEFGSDHKRKLYTLLQDYLQRFPKSDFAQSVRYHLADLTRKQANVTLPSVVVSSQPVKGTLSADNMNTAYVLLYSVPESSVDNGSLNFKNFPGKATFVKAVKVDLEGSVPFSTSADFTLPALTPGFYVAIPSETPKLSAKWKNQVRWSMSLINVSDISILLSANSKEKGSGRVYVVDAASQRPLQGAAVKFYSQNNPKQVIKTAVTDKDGSVALIDNYSDIRASKGNSVMWYSGRVYYNAQEESVQKNARILTDLSVYKPGEKVGFSVTAWSSKGHENTLLKNTSLRVTLRDANWNVVDTLTVATDNYGRLSGNFEIPTTGLLGYYNIGVGEPGNDGDFSSQGFQVAEYKSPTFIVTLSDAKENTYAPGEPVKFNGEVKTYSGMSLGSSEVKFTVDWHQWWRWWRSGVDNASYSGTVQADPDGKFVVELPTENLKNTPFDRGIFTLTATVTSPAGETQTSLPLTFALGKDFTIQPRFPDDKIQADKETLKFDIPVNDILGHPVIKEVDYTVVNRENDAEVLKGKFMSPCLEIASTSLPSGSYRFKFRLPSDTTATESDIIIWRESDKHPPLETPLWLPQTQMTVPDGAANVSVKVGSSYKGSWILCQISDEDRVIERKWLPADGDNISVDVAAPQGMGRRWVSFSGLHDHNGKIATVTLTPEKATRKMEVTTISFRDKISAGDREKWTFSFKVANQIQPGIPAMAVMSNKALDKIAPFNWNFSLGSSGWYNSSRLIKPSARRGMVSATFSTLPAFRMPDTNMPELQTYGMALAGAARYGAVMVRGVRNEMKMAATADMADGVALEESAVFMSAAPKAAMMKKAAMTGSVADVEAETAEEQVAGDAGSGSAPAAKNDEPRPVEMPLAFFMPSLLSDGQGNVNVEFVTPNFNTTWKFQITGYNDDLLSAGTVLEAVASKPVMVQANAPRYLRTGDKAYVSAILFNNSPDVQPLHGEIIIFNPLTGETVTSKHLGAEDTAPGANRSFDIEFNIPSELTAIGVRAYAYAGDFADGEQTLVPVLPSSTPVVESTQFYLGENMKDFSVKLPKFRKDASLTLKYSTNPVWECVLALPELSKPDSKSVLSLSRALYADGMAKGIMTRFPNVKTGLEKVMAEKDGAGKETLTSNLQKDSLLKTVALVNTPWVNNAQAETMRMQNLSSLLDSRKLEDAVKSLVDQLASLQNPDGGWSWCDGMRSSEFITSVVLSDIAALKSYGEGEGTEAMVKKGVAYCDKMLYDDYVKSDKKFSTVEMLRYLYVRSQLDQGDGKGGFKTLKNAAVKAVDSEWKDLSVYDKATAALLLNRTPGYEKTARLILESLRQLASKSESKGWWYDNLGGGWDGMPKLTTTARALQAFAEIEPAAEAVDGLRQWLVLQKETEDWGASTASAGVISAILNSGTDWTDSQDLPQILLDGKPVDISGAEMLTGIITVQLTPEQASGNRLSIVRTGNGPAWGGVISQYVAPIGDVKAESCENLKIEKQLLLLTDSDGATKVEKVKGSLKPGDKVRVTLTLTCKKDMDYVAVIDERAACLEPADQLSGYSLNDGLGVYREVRDTKTSFFIGYLPKGVNVISYDCYVDRDGEYALGIASAQSQYSPLQSAHSAGSAITVK